MTEGQRDTFPKSERLRHKTLVDGLFACGRSKFEYPLRMVYRPLTGTELEAAFRIGVPDRVAPLQVMFTVPKKKRRHAVDRVLMRRRMRECWRLSRRRLREAVERHPGLRTLSVALIYSADRNIDSARIAAKTDALIQKLLTELARGAEAPEDIQG
ncbi:MAG: hypothetical protein HDR80_09610 [Bacteroides sp.]|nr:hypothetical protein [Bacteroides sp.]